MVRESKLFGTIEVAFIQGAKETNTLPNIRPINKIEICAFIKKKKIDIYIDIENICILVHAQFVQCVI